MGDKKKTRPEADATWMREAKRLLQRMTPKQREDAVNDLRASSQEEELVARLTPHFQGIVDVLQGDFGYSDAVARSNFKETAARAARGFVQMHRTQEQVGTEITRHMSRRFPSKSNAMVISIDNIAWGICPHHLLPIRYVIHLAYLPAAETAIMPAGNLFVGLSKLSRVAVAVASQPILHEEVATQLADCFCAPEEDPKSFQLPSKGSAVLVYGQHLCLCARGARQSQSRTVVPVMRGAFLESEAVRNEFYQAIQLYARLERN